MGVRLERSGAATRGKQARKPSARKRPVRTPVNGRGEVDAFMAKLEHPFKRELEAVRAIIMKVDKGIAERIKWNAPSYYYMKDIGAFNLHTTKFLQLIVVFPPGMGIPPAPGLLEGDYENRREVRFHSMADVKAKATTLRKLVREWIARMDSLD